MLARTLLIISLGIGASPGCRSKHYDFTGYVYLGRDDDGWAVAIGAQDFIPALRVYRADGASATAVRAKFGAESRDAGLVFGWKRDVFRTLTRAETKDALTVMNAIWDAQQT